MSIRKVEVTLQEITRLLKGSLVGYKSDLPEDARCVDCYFDSHNYVFLFESEAFERIPEGEVIPEIMVTFAPYEQKS